MAARTVSFIQRGDSFLKLSRLGLYISGGAHSQDATGVLLLSWSSLRLDAGSWLLNHRLVGLVDVTLAFNSKAATRYILKLNVQLGMMGYSAVLAL